MIDSSVLLIGGLALVVLVAALSHRTGIASPLILLVVGAGVSFVPGVPAHLLQPEWILAGILPPLLYAAAVNVPVTDFRRNLQAIAGLSVVLVLVSTAVTGLILYAVFRDLSLPAAFAVGAVISPTDAVAATSIGKRLGLPERLITVLEGESLVNDATALVLLRSAIAATAGVVSFWSVLGQFAFAVVVGAAIGALVGYITVAVRARLADPVLTTAVSFAVPFLAYLPAEHLGASGVLASVVAGLVTGHRGARSFAASQRVTEHTNWRTIQFVLEQAVFLSMGLDFKGLIDNLGPQHVELLQPFLLGLLLTGVLLALRLIYVAIEFPIFRWRERAIFDREHHLDAIEQRLDNYEPDNHRRVRRKLRVSRGVAQRRADIGFMRDNSFGWRGSVVIGWAGMRGVVTLAAAQSLPGEPDHEDPHFPYRSLLVLIAFTVAVLTLLGFGSTLPYIIRAVGIEGADSSAFRDELRTLMRKVTTSSLTLLDDEDQTLIQGKPADPRVIERLRDRYGETVAEAESAADTPPSVLGVPNDVAPDLRLQFLVLRRRMREAAREELHDARAIGSYSSKAITAAQDLLDLDDAREDRIRDDF